ncbi:MAG: beta-lactamase family protein [Chloroflexi bacterium]|nr:beta-lactamase family protein [Chloroflexota bacterium]
MLDLKLVAEKPEDVGVDSEALDALFARAQRDVDDGTLPSAQVAVARNGKLAGLRTFGKAVQGGEERPATDETLYTIYSSTKAVVAVAIWQLLEEGNLKLEERVADIIPEFGTNGKDVVTVEQVLLHVAGFPQAPLGPKIWADRNKRLEAFSYWRLMWEPESKFEYHATSAHWVLVEIIERRRGCDFRDALREHVIDPMGLTELFVGLPGDLNDRVADVCHMGEMVEPPGGFGEVTPQAILNFNAAENRPVGVPGGGGIASAAELAMFYQTLINGGESPIGNRILKPETIEFATKVRTAHHTDLMGTPVLRGLSIVIAGDDGKANLRGFGRVASPRTFGHGGAGGQLAWGDPESGISLGYCTNGFVDWRTIGRRTTAISSLAAACAQ